MTDEKQMTVTEALKTMRIIKKRISENIKQISEYSSIVSTEKAHFNSEKEQAEEIRKLVQANEDLAQRYLDLSRRVNYTNIFTMMRAGNEQLPVADALIMDRGVIELMRLTYNAMNDHNARQRLQSMRYGQSPEGKTPSVIKLYDEREKDQGLRKWRDVHDDIRTHLETLNATNPLLEIPSK